MDAHELDTPCLLLDLDIVESNIHRMAALLEGKPARLRPHFKTPKCPQVAKMQLDAGAIGITVAWLIAVLVDSTTSVPMKVPLSAVIVALSVSTAVGLFFGIYPATKAAKLDPIEALRFET